MTNYSWEALTCLTFKFSLSMWEYKFAENVKIHQKSLQDISVVQYVSQNKGIFKETCT